MHLTTVTRIHQSSFRGTKHKSIWFCRCRAKPSHSLTHWLDRRILHRITKEIPARDSHKLSPPDLRHVRHCQSLRPTCLFFVLSGASQVAVCDSPGCKLVQLVQVRPNAATQRLTIHASIRKKNLSQSSNLLSQHIKIAVTSGGRFVNHSIGRASTVVGSSPSSTPTRKKTVSLTLDSQRPAKLLC